MRRILLDHARKHAAGKRRGDLSRLSLGEVAGLSQEKEIDFLALDAALSRLAALDTRQSRIIELTYFGGLSIEESAEVLGISSVTVKRDLRVARAWLRRELDRR
jgi:RNA polymerase sigma factor (TIGR02999 family)